MTQGKTKKQKVAKDPHAKREAKKYENPIPSREYILQCLAQAETPLSFNEIAEGISLDVSSEDGIALNRRLRAMLREGQLVVNRKGAYGLIDKMDLVRGRVSANAAGFGFLIPDEGGEDLFLSPGQMKAIFDGDIALARVSGIDRRGRKEGRIVEVVERNTHEIVGRCFQESGALFITPDSKKINHNILIADKPTQKIEDGQLVAVEIVQQPTYRSPPIGKVSEVLGDHMAPGMEIDIAIRSHQIPYKWPEGVDGELGKLPKSVLKKDLDGRVDLRSFNFVTIDGEDARDFDDAVCCQANQKGGWVLYVAIADVAHYVKTQSALDIEAVARGNSVYFPSRVIPMLPERLSNGLCSLNPKVDRLTLVCEMQVDKKGNVTSYQFMEACIFSKARLTYTQVGAFIEDEQVCDEILGLEKDLLALNELYLMFRQRRTERGAVDFETTESRFVFNEEKKIEAVVPVHRNVAHKIIEEAMLNANVCAAKFLNTHELPALYRVHEPPSEEKLNDLFDFISPLGLRLKKGKTIEPSHFQEIAEFAKGRSDEDIITTVLLRSMQQAWYSDECAPHFGLSYDEYAHFTSPIRRYPDLLVHRAIKYFIRSSIASDLVRRVEGAKRLAKKESPYVNEVELKEQGLHFSATERRADLATRDAMDWLKCEFMLDKVGNTYTGKISTVTGFGIFVSLKDIYVEGLVHISELKNDYYHYDSVNHELRAEHSQRVFRLSDEVEIQVARVDLDERKIEFVLAEDAGEISEGADSRRPKARRQVKKDGGGKGRGKGRDKGSRSESGRVHSEKDAGGKSGASSAKKRSTKVDRSESAPGSSSEKDVDGKPKKKIKKKLNKKAKKRIADKAGSKNSRKESAKVKKAKARKKKKSNAKSKPGSD